MELHLQRPSWSAPSHLCKLDADYGVTNNMVLMVRTERQMIRDPALNLREVALQKWFQITSVKKELLLAGHHCELL